jgi:ClpP class serine protease
VATGELGLASAKHGLIDEIGSKLDAIDRAAELAGLKNCEVVNVRDEYLASDSQSGQYQTALKFKKVDASTKLTLLKTPTAVLYQLYIP